MDSVGVKVRRRRFANCALQLEVHTTLEVFNKRGLSLANPGRVPSQHRHNKYGVVR